jgi:cellulase/cellobiase CelA1
MEMDSTYKKERIDVHCHVVTPKYRQYLTEHGHQNPDGMPAIPVRISHTRSKYGADKIAMERERPSPSDEGAKY